MQYMIQGLASFVLFSDTHNKIAAKIKKHFKAAEVKPVVLGNTLNFIFECQSATPEQAKDFVTVNPFSHCGEYEFRYNVGSKLIRERFSTNKE